MHMMLIRRVYLKLWWFSSVHNCWACRWVGAGRRAYFSERFIRWFSAECVKFNTQPASSCWWNDGCRCQWRWASFVAAGERETLQAARRQGWLLQLLAYCICHQLLSQQTLSLVIWVHFPLSPVWVLVVYMSHDGVRIIAPVLQERCSFTDGEVQAIDWKS